MTLRSILRSGWLIQIVAFILALCGASAAWADPPGRVGRVSYLSGTVSFFSDQEDGWQAARLNYPVTSQNSLWTEPGGRAEFRVGATALRIDHDTVLDVQVLNDDQTVLFLQRGTANIRIGVFEQRDVYRVLTPDGQIALRSRGIYRIEADPDRNETRVTAFQGKARIEAGAASVNAEAGRTLILRKSDGRPTIAFEHVARTDFDDWAQTRDERWDSPNVAHVSPHMTGYEDLDQYGSWIEESEYGRVWVPRSVSDDWAPYRYGQWRYVRPWGWTWVDDSPWGFAPFHYGRWVHVRGRWGWWPGNRIYRPIYSPALVAWVGRPGWNVSFSSGHGPGIGWLPLAPYEAFVPWYTSNNVYIHNINYIYVNRPVVVRPPTHYANLKPGATIVPTNTFHSGAPVWRNRGRLSGESVASVPVVQDGSLLPQRGTPRSPISGSAAANPGGGPLSKPAVAPVVRPSPETAQQGTPRPMGRGESAKAPVPSPLQSGPKPTAAPSPVVPYASMPSARTPSAPVINSGSPATSPQPTITNPQPRPKPNYAVPAETAQPKPMPQRAPVERERGEAYAPRGGEGSRAQPVPQYQGKPPVAQPSPNPPSPMTREARPARPEVQPRQPEQASVPRARPAPQHQEAAPRAVEKPRAAPAQEREKEKEKERPQEGRPGNSKHMSAQ